MAFEYKYEISKKFQIDCAHRVYNQQLDNEEEKCKRIHGHTYTIEVFIKSDKLSRDMVLDFNRLKIVKKFLDDYLDHRLLVYIGDTELIETFNKLLRSLGKCNAYGLSEHYEFISLNSHVLSRLLEKQHVLKLEHENPLINSVTLLPCNTTSERLGEWLIDICNTLLPIKVSKIIVRETPKSCTMVTTNG